MDASRTLRAPGTKLLAVGAVGLLLGVPLLFVGLLQWEREQRFQEVRQELAHRAGDEQTIFGPFLEVPYVYPVEEQTAGPHGRPQTIRRDVREVLVVSPEAVHYDADQTTELLRRAIYEVPAQRSSVQVTARFGPFATSLLPQGYRMVWKEARWLLGVSDLRGLVSLEIHDEAGRRVDFDAQDERHGWDNLAAPASASEGGLPGRLAGGLTLEGALTVRGIGGLHLATTGRETTARIRSDWVHPAFDGMHVPEAREIHDHGYEARWAVSSYARGLPRVALHPMYLRSHVFGARLLQPGDGYAQVGRSLKYAPIFLGLVLAAFLVIELSAGVRVHPAQYGLVGLAQVSFYLLLLALAEHFPVAWAYLASGAATTILTGLYALWTFGRRTFGVGVLGGTGLAYTFQYALVQLEDHALLLGSILVFGVVAMLMYATRRIRWYR